MSGSNTFFKTPLFFAFLAGAFCAGTIYYLWPHNEFSDQVIVSEGGTISRETITNETINSLKAALQQKENELERLRSHLLASNKPYSQENNSSALSDEEKNADAATIVNSFQIFDALTSTSEDDARTYAEKLDVLLASDMSSEAIAIASKSIYEKSDDVENLTNEKLQSLYSSHPDSDLKRVIAQVLSQRGNNTLLEDQIREQKTLLESDQESDRQEALYQLAKTRTAKAAEVIVPLLSDSNENVKIDALVALRATGNETHISKVEALLNDTDPMVRSLASDVIDNLRNLSASARTHLSNADIEAELPPMESL
jgi:hypothetical protein